jgi:hypothetical protein
VEDDDALEVGHVGEVVERGVERRLRRPFRAHDDDRRVGLAELLERGPRDRREPRVVGHGHQEGDHGADASR